MTRHVALPMYDAPAEALAAFWAGLRRHLETQGFRDLPAALDRPDDLHAHWRSPNLLLSQTCGRPLSTTLRGAVALVATPHYAAPGCDGPFYSSIIVVRNDDPAASFEDLRGRRAAFNGRDSHSGFSQLFAMATEHDDGGAFFSAAIESGAHRRSMAMVADGRADVAAIDGVTYALAARDRPETTANLHVLAVSPSAPGLPFITSKRRSTQEIDRLRAALLAALSDPSLAAARAGLLLTGISVLPMSAYDVCRDRAAVADATAAR